MQAARAQVGERVEVVTSRAFSARASCATSPASSPPVSPLPSTDTWPEVLRIFYLSILECQMFVRDIITDQRYLHSSGWLDTLVPTLQRFNSHLKRSGQHWSWLLLLSVSMHDRVFTIVVRRRWLLPVWSLSWSFHDCNTSENQIEIIRTKASVAFYSMSVPRLRYNQESRSIEERKRCLCHTHWEERGETIRLDSWLVTRLVGWCWRDSSHEVNER